MVVSPTLQKFISMESFYSQSLYNIKKEWVFRSVRRFSALPDCVQTWSDAGPAGLNQTKTRAPVVQSRACSSHTSCRTRCYQVNTKLFPGSSFSKHQNCSIE